MNIQRLLKASSLALAIMLTAASATSAANFTVTTTADSGAGSLRQAVLDANATTANDTINFNIPAASCTSGVCTITLTGGELVVSATSTVGTLTISNAGAKIKS